jgi:signal transduction histidine kinase
MMTPASVKILVVDDDDGGRYVKAHTLARQGYVVTEAGFAQMALESIAEALPDLMLLDVRLPDGDGVELCRHIKTAFPQITVLQTSSALISAQDRALSLEAGADSYLIEPIEPDELVAVVRAVLRMREAEQALRQLNEVLEAQVVQRAGELAESHRQLASEAASRRQAEDILWHTQKLEAVGRLTGGVAHDFNNLLTIITGNLELLQGAVSGGGSLSPERQLRLIGAALKAAEHGAQMTQQLLAFARRGILSSTTVDLNTMIAGMGDFLRRTLGDAITLQFSRAPELWPCNIDPVQFEAALINLAINARDAMADGGTLRIELGNAAVDSTMSAEIGVTPGHYVRVRVIDTGAGMEPDVAERAFEPFFTTKEIGEGSGLGLSQVYGYVSQSGGEVKLTSTPGVGTAVVLYLPRSKTAVEKSNETGDGVTPSPPGRETILIVEDDEQVRDVAVAMIEDLGYKVLLATNGVDALKLLRGNMLIDLLFSDILMPGGISGRHLATQARGIRPQLKVLLTSGYPARDADADGSSFPIILKPYRRDKLAAMLRSALDLRQSASMGETPDGDPLPGVPSALREA